MPYGITEISSKTIGDIESNLENIVKNQENYGVMRKHIENIIKILELFLQREIDNLFFQDIMPKITKLPKILRELLKYFKNEENPFDKSLMMEINFTLSEIIKKIREWIEVVKIKSQIPNGNSHLIDLKIHKLKTRFYAKIKELNPDHTLVMKHPIDKRQEEIQRNRTTKDLLKLDEEDPIMGGRENRKGDDYNYPGSLLVVTQGHHRLYELYKRYLQGIISGDTLVEFIIDKKFLPEKI